MTNDRALNLNFDASGEMTNQYFGITENKTGHRIVQIMAKFVF